MTDYNDPKFWEKAPLGTTHYNPLNGDWYIVSGDTAQAWNSGDGWISAALWHERNHLCIARPSAQRGGDGLPPVGSACERNVSRSNWCETRIYAHSPCGRFAAFLDSCGMNWTSADSFRPLKTPAQLAAEKREAEIQEIQRIVSNAFDSRSILAEAIYEAGYRKPEKE